MYLTPAVSNRPIITNVVTADFSPFKILPCNWFSHDGDPRHNHGNEKGVALPHLQFRISSRQDGFALILYANGIKE